MHYIYFGYRDVPLGRVSIFHTVYWYKERYRILQFWYKEQYQFQALCMKCQVRYTFSKNLYMVDILVQKIDIRNRYVFDHSMVGLRTKVGQVHPLGIKIQIKI